MSTIFIDESGYTGEDLMNSDQPIFALATLNLSENDCRELKERFFKKVKSPELKHSKLVRNPNRQGLIIDFLKELSNTPVLVKFHITHKRYALVNNLIRYVVMPAAEKDGIDLRIKGRDIGLTYCIYHDLPKLVGKEFFEDLMRRFQKMMIDLNHGSYHLFFDPFFDERYPQVSDEEQQRLIDYLLWHIKIGHTSVRYGLIDQLDASAQSLGIPRSRPLDIGFVGALILMERWRRETTDSITLIHDASSRMKETFHFWETNVHTHAPSATLWSGENTATFPIGISETFLQDSTNWVGLQLADILAGAATRWINWGENGAKSDDEYGVQLNNVMPSFPLVALWPPTNPTLEDFEKLGITEEEAQLQDQYSERVAAFHRLRAHGIFYQAASNASL